MIHTRSAPGRPLPLVLVALLAACQSEKAGEFFNPPQEIQARSEFRLNGRPMLAHRNLTSSAAVEDGQASWCIWTPAGWATSTR